MTTMMPPGRRLGRRATLILLAATALAAAAPVPRAAAQDAAAPLDLPTLLRLVADGSQAAATAAADLEAATAGIDRSRAHWWPSVDLSGQYTWRDNPIEAQAGTFSFPTTEQNNGQYALEARELVYDGGRRSLAVDAAERRAEAVRLGGAAAVQQAQLEAVDAYLAILELTGSRRVLESRRQALEAHQRTVQDLFDQGLTARNDLLETGVRVRAVDDQLQAVDDRLAVARGDLNRRLGRDPQSPLALPDSLPPPPALAGGRDALLADAVQANARLLAADARHAAGLGELALARRAWFPSLFVGAQHAYVQNQYLVHESLNMVTAGVAWNLFDGGVRKADIRRAEAATASTARDRLEVERAVGVAVDDAWRRWEQAHRELGTARADVEAAGENLRIVEDQYREGVARSSDVLDAETLLARARFDVVRRHYQTYRAQADLLTAAGRDLAAFYGGAPAGAGKD